MNDKEILAELAALESELQSKISSRDELSVEILVLQNKIHAFSAMFLREALAEKGRQFTAVGLTEAIRVLLRKHGEPMTTAEVKMGLQILGFDLKRFKNPSAAVANTLLRMARTGELRHNTASKTYALLPNYYDAVLQAADKVRR